MGTKTNIIVNNKTNVARDVNLVGYRGQEINDNNPVHVTGGTVISNAIDVTGYDLQASSFNNTTAISKDYILNSIIMNFSSSEQKTITILGSDGTILSGGVVDTSDLNILRNNTDMNLVIPFDLAFDSGDEITIQITQTSGACNADIITKVTHGGNLITATGDVNVTNTVTTQTINYSIRIDDVSELDTTYIGKADIGSSTSASVWQIHKVDETSGNIFLWADGNDNFDNIWDNRTSLTYN